MTCAPGMPRGRNQTWDRRSGPLICARSAVLVVALLACPSLKAQLGTSSLVVEVVDQGTTPLPGVTVEVVRSGTGLRRLTITGNDGSALILALPPGAYQVTATLEGMTLPGRITLRVDQRARLELHLYPQVDDEVTVTDESPLVDFYRTDSSTNIVPEQIESLPVADRQFEKLAFLAPTVARDRTPYFDRTGAPVIGAAGNSGVAAVMVDGVDFADQWIGQSRLRLSLDSIQEFRVIGQGFDSEVGGTTGGGLSVVTKRGTNDLHGTAFLFLRDKALRERGALELEQGDYARNHAGFAIGGPIARDRTHFFGSFEHLSEDDVALVRPGGAFTHLAADVPRPREQSTSLLSLDHGFSNGSAGTTKLYWERYRRDNYEVGGVIDQSHGWSWDRDVWTLVAGHTWVMDYRRLNEIHLQVAQRDAKFPVNSSRMGEWFSSGATLRTGSRYLENEGPLEGEVFGLRGTHHWQPAEPSHQLKAGIDYQHLKSFYREDRFENGLMVYLADDRSQPYVYVQGVGSSATSLETDQIGLFVQDEWRISDRLTVSLGLRYDLDTRGNLPEFEHPLVPDGRPVDYDNLQPRLGFSWDLGGEGTTVVHGGVGRFVGHYNQYSLHMARGLNDAGGHTINFRVSLPEFGLLLDPNDPLNTGWSLPPNITLLGPEYQVPETTQARLGLTRRLGARQLYLEVEGVYAEGRHELLGRNTNWAGNHQPGWLSPDYTEVYTFTSDGRSRYQALSLGLRGKLPGRHLITSGLLLADKHNLRDDPNNFDTPSDPADPQAEWGPSGNAERARFVASGVFRLPWDLSLSAIYEYGSGRPWTRVYGYDYNGDSALGTDRPEGVARNDMDGPRFSQFDLLLTRHLGLGGQGDLEIRAEVFNLFGTVNYDVNSVDPAIYLAGPTLANPTVEFVPNPRFGTYLATHRPREIQLGIRYSF